MDTMIVTEIVRKFPDLATRRVPDHLSQFTLDFSTSQLEALTFKAPNNVTSTAPNSHALCDRVRTRRVLGKFPAKIQRNVHPWILWDRGPAINVTGGAGR
ncbi:MAG: hypothetical protein ACREX4_04530 [Gammaproteobacteria bacterium]